MSYAQVNGAANQVANLLVSRGIGRGDKVALSCPNLPYFSIIYFGILKAGATVVPLNVLLKGREVAYHLADSEAKAYFAFEGPPTCPSAMLRTRASRPPTRARSSSSSKLDSAAPGPAGAPRVLRATGRRAAADVRHGADR